MYCPSCGKDNFETARFCRSCGRSLIGVLHPTQPESESGFERIEHRMEELIASHASRYFKTRAAPYVPSTSLKESWKLLGQGYLAIILDLFYTYLILNFVLDTRLVMLLFKSPIEWLRRRKRERPPSPAMTEIISPPQRQSLIAPPESVTDQTTERLADYVPPRDRA
jgi:hypothetical protein